MSIENNKMQVDIEILFKQNVNDLTSIKELYRKIEELEKKISQIKYINAVMNDKIRKEIKILKDLIQDETSQKGGF